MGFSSNLKKNFKTSICTRVGKRSMRTNSPWKKDWSS